MQRERHAARAAARAHELGALESDDGTLAVRYALVAREEVVLDVIDYRDGTGTASCREAAAARTT